MRKWYGLVLFVALLNTLLAAIVFSKSLESHPENNLCTAKCDIVLGSKYAKVFGIPQALIGIFSFTLLAIVSAYFVFRKNKKLEIFFPILLIIGSLYALRMLYIQAFILHAFCPYCVAIDASTILVTLVFIIAKKRRKGYVFAP